MKKLFILAAAIVAFASCSKDPETVINDGSIYFTNALTTRTTVVTDASSLQKGFKVLGYANDLEIFSNAEATYASDKNAWTVSPVKYWANNTNYNFFALYSVNADYKFTNITSTDKTSATLASFTNTGDDDLVLAGRNITTDNGGKDRGAAELVFKHALSRVKFSFKNDYSDTADNVATKIKVSDVKLIGQVKTADVTITSAVNADDIPQNPALGTSTSAITWSNIATTGTNLDFAFDAKDDSYGDGDKIAEQTTETTDYQYIIPNTATYQLACLIQVFDENDNLIREFDKRASYIDVKVSGNDELKHIAGESYNYTMNITSDLNNITFTVAVEEWSDDEERVIDFEK